MQSLSPRCLSALIVLCAGCLPPIPPLDASSDDTDDGGSSGSQSVAEDSTEGSTEGPADADSSDSSDGALLDTGADSTDASDATDDGDDETGTGGNQGECEGIDALVYPGVADQDVVGNCMLEAAFQSGVAGIAELRVPEGSGQNLIFDNGTAVERYTGVVNWEEYTNADSVTSLTVLQSGPAVFRIRIVWSQSPAAGEGFEGESIYTVVGDGRIVRDEYVHVLEQLSGNWLVAHNALRAAELTDIAWDGISVPAHADTITPNGPIGIHPFVGEGVLDEDFYVCAYHHGTGDVVGWTDFHGGNDFVGARATQERHAPGPENASVILQADWVRGGDPGPFGEYEGQGLLHVSHATAGNECDAIDAHYGAYRAPGSVTPGSGAMVASQQVGDADGDGFSQGGGFYTLEATGGSAVNVSIDGGASTLPSVLLHIAGLDAQSVTGVDLGGAPLPDDEYIVQAANAEGGGVALESGAFVLIEGPVQDGLEITVHHGG